MVDAIFFMLLYFFVVAFCFFVYSRGMKSNKLVVKKNVLIPEFVKLRHQEKRFLSFCIAELNPKNDVSLGRFTVNISAIADVFGLSKTHTYLRIREAATAINSRPIFRHEGKRHSMDFWFSWLDYFEGSGNVEIQFNERLMPLLLDLKDEYIQYRLSMVASFNNNNTWSLYEILKQWVRAGKKAFTLDELKELLGVVGKYARWSNFKAKRLTPAIKEINEKSDIQVKYEAQRKGRSVVGLVFFIDKKQADEVITVESKQDILFKSLLSYGLNEKTVRDYIHQIERKDKTESILNKLPQMAINAKLKKAVMAKYITGAIKQELQGNRYDELPEPPDHKEALDCWIAKKQNGEKCKVRKRGTPGQRKKCKICLEKLPIESFGV